MLPFLLINDEIGLKFTPETPTIIILHGLTGGSYEPYVQVLPLLNVKISFLTNILALGTPCYGNFWNEGCSH